MTDGVFSVVIFKGGFMMRRKISYTIILAMGIVLSWGLWVANSQQQPPTENKGFKTLKTESIDLKPEIEGMKDRKLRLRLLTIEPGGYIGIHSHEDRPAVVYVIQGTDTITFGDGSVKRLRAGDTGSATKDTTHWHRNDEKEPVVFVAVDIQNAVK
jgi:quercetin dioxygenase-like cupin family protein